MWLSDYELAIEAMRDAFEDACFEAIYCSYDGSLFIFEPVRNGDCQYNYYRKTGRITKTYKDTWRNPDHMTVIKEGKK